MFVPSRRSVLSIRSSRRTWLPILVCAAVASISGCESEDPAGSGVLVIPYELGNMRDCESLGIVKVRAELDDEYLVEEVACDAGEVRFDRVPADNYSVKLFGIDADGYRTMDSVEAGSVTLQVIGEGTTVVADPAIQLTAAPAQLMMRWDFGFSTCDSAAIDTFEVMAWRQDGSQLLMETDVDCAMRGDGVDQYRLIPDGDRELAGDVFGEVSIQAVDKNGTLVGDSVGFFFETPGAGRLIRLSLDCTGSGCSGTGEPD